MLSRTKNVSAILKVAAVTLLLFAPATAQPGPACNPIGNSSALLVTPNCVDELYSIPIIDSQKNETFPVPHLHVSGHFDNTTIRFNFYFPPKAKWGGRFFQFVYPTQSENATDEHISFGTDSQAYTVQITGTNGYRAEAAGAKFSRVVAQRYYQPKEHIYGYIYGGSGGSYQTVGAMENTVGVWDGGVPIIQGVPVSAPSGPSARAFFRNVLQPKMAQIQDALRPGGSGDPYLGLSSVEQDILSQATMFGIPIRAWEDFNAIGDRSHLSIQQPFVSSVDATYGEDFWTQPGYLGTEPGELGDIMRDSLITFNATVQGILRNADNVPIALELNKATPNYSRSLYDGWSFDISVSSTNGTGLGQLRGRWNTTRDVLGLEDIGLINEPSVLNSLSEGVNVAVSNRLFIALHAFHRHQVPDRAGFIGFDQYRSKNHSAIFPQRPIDASKVLSEAICGGCTHSGRIKAKMIVVQNLIDSDAFPWHGHWYRNQVKQSLGEEAFEDNYRIYYNDHADHTYGEPIPYRASFIVNFNGIYQQALRDLSAWVEKGTLPPPASNYKLTGENLITLPATATERAGIQPVARLRIGNGTFSSSTGDVATYISYAARVGEELPFNARVEVPPGTGKIIDLEWDFLGTSDFTSALDAQPQKSLDVTKTFSYSEPGNYTVVLRVTSQREGNVDTPFGRVRNLVRMHVQVE